MKGDFVAGVITDSTSGAERLRRVRVQIHQRLAEVVVGGGDTVVMFKDSPAAGAREVPRLARGG
jgi:hypothetical protein